MKAMILAAGFGTRMRPLTERYPKPVLPVLNIPVIQYVVATLQKAGVTEICVNVHHLPDLVKYALTSPLMKDLKIHFSHENEILGTGGGILNAKEFFSSSTFVVINSDMVVDIDLLNVLRVHQNNHAQLTLVLREDIHAENYGGIGLSDNNEVCRILNCNPSGQKPVKTAMFTGIQILESSMFQYFPSGLNVFDTVKDVYIPFIEKGQTIHAYMHDGFWAETGNPERFLDTNMQLLKKYAETGECMINPGGMLMNDESRNSHRDPVVKPPVLADFDTRTGPHCLVGPNVIMGKNCILEENVTLQNTVVFPGTVVPENTNLRNCIIDSDTVLKIA